MGQPNDRVRSVDSHPHYIYLTGFCFLGYLDTPQHSAPRLTLSNRHRLASANSSATSFIICAARFAVIEIFVSHAHRSARRHLMPLHESEAIVLQSYALGEADRI